MRRALSIIAACCALLMFAVPSWAEDFTYNPVGELVSGSGQGRDDATIYVPDMRFPIENAPAYANSQVWGHGGAQGPGGTQCDAENYSYPWWDNYCETRSWSMPLCPAGEGHQGQDIRPATCDDNTHWAVAAETGEITNVGSYSVYLQADNGTRHRYLHMNSASVQVTTGQRVNRGNRLGRISDNMGDTPTTIHLHYDLHQNVDGVGDAYVPTYMSLVDSYERLVGLDEPCEALGAGGGLIDDGDPCFELHGPADSWRHVTEAGYDGDLRWTYAWDDEASNWVQWHLELAEQGTYRVDVYVVPEYAQSRQARYVIRHAGQETEERLDYTAESGEGWRTLGEFDFAAGADQWVANFDNTGESLDAERPIIADAMRLERVEEEPEPDPDPEPDAGDSEDAGSGEPDAAQVADGGGIDQDASGGDGDASGEGDESERSNSSVSTSSCAHGGGGPVGWLVALVVVVGWRGRPF